MKILIAFESKHGCTETCALRLKEKLGGTADLLDLKKASAPPAEDYDIVALGGSIHAGKIQRRVKKFVENHTPWLTRRKFGLFLCCLDEGEGADKEFKEAFPEDLRNRAAALGLFGGAVSFEKMNFLEKAIMKKIAKTDQSFSKIREDNIDAFAKQLLS